MAATAVTLNDLEGHLLVAGLFKCNPPNTCPTFYTISTDSALARFLCAEADLGMCGLCGRTGAPTKRGPPHEDKHKFFIAANLLQHAEKSLN